MVLSMNDHHTKQKGDLGVLKAQCDLHEQGFIILVPLSEHCPFDIVALKDGIFKRVQVKYRAAVEGKISVPLTTCWADINGIHRTRYENSEIDVICVYCPDTDKCYYMSVAEVSEMRSTFNLRVEIPKNNQRSGIRMADDYRRVP